MKLKSVTIKGMRNVDSKTHVFDNVNYISGNNGAGKSTIIDGICLALLGYIPGQPKTNKSIMLNANGTTMTCEITLSDGDKDITISRSWIRNGKSVQSVMDVKPADFNPEWITDGIEVPVYNFNELLGKSANDQKSYFIEHILTDSECDIDIESRIKDNVSNSKLDPKYTADVQAEVLDRVNSSANTVGMQGIELIKDVYAYLKELQSQRKIQLQECEKTLSTLVQHDSEDLRDVEEIEKEIKETNDKLTKLRVQKNQKLALDKWKESAGELLDEVDSFDESADIKESEQYKSLVNARAAYSQAIVKLQERDLTLSAEIDKVKNKIADIKARITSNETIINSGGVCQYTNESCPAIVKMIEELKSNVTKNCAKLDKLRADLTKLGERRAKFDIERKNLDDDLTKAQSVYDDYSKKQNMLRMLKKSKPELIDCDVIESEDILNERLKSLSEELKSVNENNAYNRLYDGLVSRKSKIEIEQQIIKSLIKLTGPNQLQSEVMEKPFKEFKNRMDVYIHKMFNENSGLKFILSEESNSFSFGLERSGSYTAFQTLSSGEKCMFMLAFVSTIIENQDEATLHTIIVDDSLDHLDSKSSAKVFEKLAELTDGPQYILAGVIPCKVREINRISV